MRHRQWGDVGAPAAILESSSTPGSVLQIQDDVANAATAQILTNGGTVDFARTVSGTTTTKDTIVVTNANSSTATGKAGIVVDHILQIDVGTLELTNPTGATNPGTVQLTAATSLITALNKADVLDNDGNQITGLGSITSLTLQNDGVIEAIADEIDRVCAAGGHVVIACSALKRAYRNLLIHGRNDVRIVFLKGTKALIADRLALRKHHFMPPGLLDSQFKTLESPESDEHVITAPMVGTFYASPSPGAKPFVEIGDEIKVGQVLCIIEAMKMMNQIEADKAGRITSVMVKSGDPVEFGQPLFIVE